MKNRKLNILILALFACFLQTAFSQVNSLQISEEKEKSYTPYMYHAHGGPEGVAQFKAEHRYDYLKELWYYAESFYVKRNYLSEGVRLDESGIDISRFESFRKENEEGIVKLPGYCDVLVLLPKNALIFQPRKK
jgi:hypothetical protein